MRWSRIWLTIAAVVGVALTGGCRAAEEVEAVFTSAPDRLGATDPLRGVWVTRWDYITADDVATIMRNAARAGFTDVFWQVRGQADAYYESDLEPWGELLFRENNDDKSRPTVEQVRRGPGYDPLATAVRLAHRRGLRLHAWMNVMPLWKGKAEPVSPAHPWLSRRSWRLMDETGAAQPLGDGYVIANPVLDDFQDHVVAVARDIVTRYKVDGLHLDYVRFMAESLGGEHWYPGDAVSRALYRQAKGLRPRAVVGPDAMRAWVRDRITGLVRRIGREAVSQRESVALTAAVWRRPDLARDQQLQDAAVWANRGWVDAVIPMIYTDNDARFSGDLHAWAAAVRRRGAMVPGVGVYKHKSGRQTIGQIRMNPDDSRFVLFAYSALFASRAPGSEVSLEAESDRQRRLIPLRAMMNR